MLDDMLTRWIAQDYPLEARLKAGASEIGYSRAAFGQLCELGVAGALFDESVGGFGGAGFDFMVVFQAVGRGLIVEPLLASAVLAGGALALAGGNKALVAGVMSGDKVGTLALSEPGAAYDAHEVTSRATRTPDGWCLDGAKSVVRHANAADFLIIPAQTPKGISLFLVARDASGLSLRDYPTIDGGRAGEVVLEGVNVAQSALIGEEGQGDAILDAVLGRGLLCLTAEGLGLMEHMRDMTLAYLREREQFGVPIGKFQVLQHRMAEMVLEIEQAQSAVINAAAALDTPGIAREKALSAAKMTVGRVGRLVAEESIQMHGGIGMTWEYPLGHYAKRLTMIDHELGDEDFHLARFIRLGAA